MSKKRKVLYIVLIIFLIFSYFGRQSINYFWIYNINYFTGDSYHEWMRNFKIVDTISINKNSSVMNDYVTFKNIKIRNDFNDYSKMEQISTDDSVKYVLYDENNESVASFWISKRSSYVEMLKGDVSIFGGNDEILSSSDRISFLKKENIVNDVDLVKYLANNKNIKNSFFDSNNKMQENYTIQFLSMNIFPKVNSIVLIDGDYSGYIIEVDNNIKEVHIINGNDEVLGFTFANTNYYTDEYIKNLLSTLVIES